MQVRRYKSVIHLVPCPDRSLKLCRHCCSLYYSYVDLNLSYGCWFSFVVHSNASCLRKLLNSYVPSYHSNKGKSHHVLVCYQAREDHMATFEIYIDDSGQMFTISTSTLKSIYFNFYFKGRVTQSKGDR